MTQQTCPKCFGYGHSFQVVNSGVDRDDIPFASYENCDMCGGTGRVMETNHNPKPAVMESSGPVSITQEWDGSPMLSPECKAGRHSDCGPVCDCGCHDL